MKKRITGCALAFAVLALGLSACSSTADWDTAGPLIERAREMNSAEKEASVLLEFLKKCRDADDFENAAEYYEKQQEPASAEKILAAGIQSLQKRKDDASEDLTEKYLSLLAEQGKLDLLRQNAPELAKIPVNGKPFGEYDRESLLALIPSENITYVDDVPGEDYYYYDAAFRNVDLNISGSTDETYPHYSISFYNLSSGRGSGKGEGPQPVLPQEITADSTFADCLSVLGFDADCVQLLQNYSSVTIYLEERGMDFYVYDYSPEKEYRYVQINYALRSCDGSIGFNFVRSGLDSYDLSWSA